MKMNWKIALATFGSIFLYTYILACFGFAGPDIQTLALHGGVIGLKYGLLLFGLVLFAILPYRVSQALEKRKQAKYDIESDRKIVEAARKKKAEEDKIMKEFIKNEDTI